MKKVKIIEAEVCLDHIHNAGEDTTEDECVRIHRISQKEKYVADTRTAWKFEI